MPSAKTLTSRQLAIEVFGWYGTVAILVAYAMVAWGWLAATSLVAISLNLTGAVGIVVVTFSKRSWQPLVINSVWTFIALVALYKVLTGMK